MLFKLLERKGTVKHHHLYVISAWNLHYPQEQFMNTTICPKNIASFSNNPWDGCKPKDTPRHDCALLKICLEPASTTLIWPFLRLLYCFLSMPIPVVASVLQVCVCWLKMNSFTSIVCRSSSFPTLRHSLKEIPVVTLCLSIDQLF